MLLIAIFLIVLIKSTLYSPVKQIKPISVGIDSTVKEHSFPSRLSIPLLGIDAKVQKVGITASGNMATPNNFVDVGWYKYGTIPGDKGSAVIAGHVDNGLAFPGVFSKLKNIKEGDDIFVETENSQTLHFVVKEIKTYPFDAKVKEVFSRDDGRWINLITCTGIWVEKHKTHNKRLVVSAILVEK